jgi:putative tricarboxylic transport membrane protein
MDVLHNLILGFGVVFSPVNLLYCFFGVTIGTLIGVLPGIGGLATMAMLTPFTFNVAPVSALIMLAGIYYGTTYGGSTTSILVNIPGESSSVITCLDGYKMAQQGRAGPALSIAAFGSFFAGCFATVVIAVLGPFLANLALKFGPAEYFSMMVLGLVCAIVLAHRFTFGAKNLSEGIDFIVVSMGLFGFAEIIASLEGGKSGEKITTAKIRSLWPTRADLRASWKAVLRGTGLGCMLGILPGGGALVSSFASYALEKKLASDPSRFGKGAIEGVAGPESANNAGAQTSFIPMLTLGIPSNVVMAFMLGAMMIHGVAPGPQVMVTKPDLFWGLIASMWIGNVMLVILNLPLIGIWVRLLAVPYRLLYPAVLMFSCIGMYSINNSTFDLFLGAGFGIAGYVFVKLGCEPAPLLLAFILGPKMEEYLRRAMLLSRGDSTVLVTSPLSCAMLIAAAILVFMVVVPSIRHKRDEALKE